jgi:diguanylate cyclase (GGDEF)-like protein
MIDKGLIFAKCPEEAWRFAGFALATALCFSVLLWIVAQQFRRQARQNAKLEEAAISLHEGQQMLRGYAEMSVDWFWEQDTDFRFKQKTLIPFLISSDDAGMTRWELAGSAMSEERWVSHKAQLDARLPFRNFRWERIGTDGARHFITVSGDPVFDRKGEFSGYRGTGRDITAEVRAHARLQQANLELELGRQRFDAVLNNMSQGICLFDSEKRLLLSNRRYAEIYDLLPEATLPGRTLEEIVADRYVAGSAVNMSLADFLAWRDQVVTEAQPVSTVTSLVNGRIVAIHHQPMPDGGWIATHEDITERRQAEASIVFMAHHDALTRLANRLLFHERLEQAVDGAGRGGKCAVLCLDLDRFKLINDTLGHQVGDGLLQAVADRLQACVRETDTVARLGGDEFAIVQSAIERPEDAELLATRIITAFGVPFEIDEHTIVAGTSVGVAMAPGDGTSPGKLLKNADIALYLAKTEGRSKVRFFEPEMDARIQLRRLLELDLRGALSRNEFELYYQPSVNLATGTITGFEALLRWHHPARGMVSPAEFIPLAEETGIIVAIGEWVLQTACFEAENWPADISVAVNLSSAQFKKGNIVAVVRAALDASGLPPDRLELEITESLLLQESAGTLAALREFRTMGIAVALDDFGTGYSSLSYLRSFPFDKIKIDQSFVRDLVQDKEAMSIIRAVTGLGHSLRIKTTAEGVETQEQLDKLRAEGCNEVQGYFFSQPEPASEVSALIKRLGHADQTVI